MNFEGAPSEYQSAGTTGNIFRAQVILVIDTSRSMDTKTPRDTSRIEELRVALGTFLAEDLVSTGISEIGELGILTFNTKHTWVRLAADPVISPSHFYRTAGALRLSEPLRTGGNNTLVVPAIREAARRIDERTKQMLSATKPLSRRYKTQIYLLSDGAVHDSQRQLKKVAELLRERAREIVIFAFGVYGADFEVLRLLSPFGTYDLGETNLRDVLRAVSISISETIALDRKHSVGPNSNPPYAPAPEYVKVRRALTSSLNPVFKGFDYDYE